MYQVEHYLTRDGRDPFADWLASLADRRARAVDFWNDWQERNKT